MTMEEEQQLLHSFQANQRLLTRGTVIVLVVVVVLGVITGYVFAQRGRDEGLSTVQGSATVKNKVIGVADPTTFPDSAEGVLEKGGIDGEGTHHLLREGGPSQTVYLTSSVLDLDQVVGRKVRVWGETYSAEKAGWLMDVGRVEILE